MPMKDPVVDQWQQRRRWHTCVSMCVGAIALYLASSLGAVQAVTASPHGYRYKQPDGSWTPLLYLHGDEALNYETDAEGFTVVVDEENGGWYVYAKGASDHDGLVSSGGRVGFVRPQKLGLEPGLRPPEPSRRLPVQDPTKAISQTPSTRRDLRFAGEKGNPKVLKVLVVLIRFADHADRALPSHQDLEILFNEPGGHPQLAPTGSVRDIWMKESCGKFDMPATVTQWIDLPETEAYYANNVSGWGDPKIDEAFRHALHHLDRNTNINLEDFDENEDEYFDGISFVHSGFGAELGSEDCASNNKKSQRIWSHRGASRSGWVSSTGVQLSSYFITSAIWPLSRDPLCDFEVGHVGVFVHESGHQIGLPDLYDRSKQGFGIGNFDFMASMWGWDGSQRYPPPLSPWSKMQLGWVNRVILNRAQRYEITASSSVDEVYVINHNFPDPENEYLVVENRHADGFDMLLPGGGGLAIYHIDRKAGHSAPGYPDMPVGEGEPKWPHNARHYQNALLSADGKYYLERKIANGHKGDLFRAGSSDVANAIAPDGINTGKPFPNTDSYQGGVIVKTGISITDISEAGFVMSFVLSGDGLLEECEDIQTFVNSNGRGVCKKLRRKKKKKKRKECKKREVAENCPSSCNPNCT